MHADLLLTVLLFGATAVSIPAANAPDLPIEERATPRWQRERDSKNAAVSASIPAQWRLSAAMLAEAKTQQRFIGTKNDGKSIEDFIRTLPAANFTNPYVDGVSSSAAQTVTITNTDPVDLVAAMKVKKYTAVDVVTAFCLRSAIIHQVVSIALRAWPVARG
jgi:hypothetical protein